MVLLAKKLSIIAALLALIVALAAGGLSGLSWGLVLMRGGAAFFMVMASSMVLFSLALKHPPEAGGVAEAEENNER